MKINYICHSCLLIETVDAKIAIDPWFNGPAYMGQWHLFPKPVNTSILNDATHILVTHGHEDHLHLPSLKMLPKNAEVFYPYQWAKGVVPLMQDLGFDKVTEAVSYRKYKIGADTTICYIANGLDSIVIIESGGKVFVNLNDALNSHHKWIIRFFAEKILSIYPKIDYLFCGLGGASYFPNCVHHSSKNDREVAVLREQFLVHNFCKLTELFKPHFILPFTPGFALLEDNKQWINEIKFPRENLAEYYANHFNQTTSTRFINMYPGDTLLDDTLQANSPYHNLLVNHTLHHTISTDYAKEIAEKREVKNAEQEEINYLLQLMQKHLNKSAESFKNDALSNIQFTVQLTNVNEKPFINITRTRNEFTWMRSSKLAIDSGLLIKVSTEALIHSYENEWGGDVLLIGYAVDIDVLKTEVMERNEDIICLRLLTRYPTALKQMKNDPMRGLKYLATNPQLSTLLVKQKLVAKGKANALPFNERSHWINKSKCEICMVCDLPVISYDLGEQMEEQEHLAAGQNTL